MYKIRNPGEILQVFDEQGNPTQIMPRAALKAEPRKYWCAVVDVWLINNRSEILCSKRSELFKNGKWQTYFGGHLKAGQTYQEAVVSEMDEEVGLCIDTQKLFSVGRRIDKQSLQHAESYVYPFDGSIADLRYKDSEIVDARWMNLEEIFREVKEFPENWCNLIKLEYEPIIREWIKMNKIF